MYLMNTNVFKSDSKYLASGPWLTPTSPEFLNDFLCGSGSPKASFNSFTNCQVNEQNSQHLEEGGITRWKEPGFFDYYYTEGNLNEHSQ